MEVNQVDIQEIVSRVIKNLNQTEAKSNSGQAKVAMLTRKEHLEVQTHTLPEISADEILVKVEGCGICGTDVHEYKNDPFDLIPVVLGHEGTGEIVQLGANVKKDMLNKPLAVGDKIVTSVIISEDDEFTTLKPERMNLSDHMSVYGLLPDDDYKFNGWFGEYIILRKGSSVFKVNDLSLKERILVEPLAVAIHAVERAKSTGLLKFNTVALVQGCGPIGLSVISVLRTLGTENIIAVDGDDQRLAMARRLGADTTLNFKHHDGPKALQDHVNEITSGGVDFAFQCTGVPAAASTVYKFIRRGGGLCEVGFFVDGGDATINPHFDICQKEITTVGSWVYNFGDYANTLDFIRRAKGIGLPLEELITHTFSLHDLNEAMAVNMKLEGIKIAYINA